MCEASRVDHSQRLAGSLRCAVSILRDLRMRLPAIRTSAVCLERNTHSNTRIVTGIDCRGTVIDCVVLRTWWSSLLVSLDFW